jgi:16S rRNA (guanine1207-N2)-methyltransferase
MTEQALSSVIQIALSGLSGTYSSGSPAHIACLHAQLDDKLHLIAKSQNWVCEQGFYPDYKALQKSGAMVEPRLSDSDYDLVIVMAPRMHQFALAEMARALTLVKPNQPILVAALNLSGGRRLVDDCERFGLRPQSFVKSKCRAVIAFKDKGLDETAVHMALDLAKPRELANGTLSRIGLFAWDRLDQGTELLLNTMDAHFLAHPKLTPIGHVCDLGSGLGPIMDHMLRSYSKIETMTGIEAEYEAVKLAQRNLNDHQGRFQLMWGDARETGLSQIDTVVSNPPFHTDRQSRPELGQEFIRSAALVLKKGGRFYCVANRQLPYEAELKARFSSAKILKEENGFKVFEAIK